MSKKIILFLSDLKKGKAMEYRCPGGGPVSGVQTCEAPLHTIKKHEIILHDVLEGLVRIILRLGNSALHIGLNENVEISIGFDDSIIEDKAQNKARIYQMLSAGLMRSEEARSILTNEDIETAKAALPQMIDLVTEPENVFDNGIMRSKNF